MLSYAYLLLLNLESSAVTKKNYDVNFIVFTLELNQMQSYEFNQRKSANNVMVIENNFDLSITQLFRDVFSRKKFIFLDFNIKNLINIYIK